MEALGVMLDGEWNTFGGMYSTDQESAFMAQLLGLSALPNELPNSSYDTNMFMSEVHEDLMCFSTNTRSTSTYSDLNSIHFPSSESYYQSHPHHASITNDVSVSDLCIGEDDNNTLLIEEGEFLKQDMSSGSVESEGHLPEAVVFENNLDPLVNSKKRTRVSGEVQKRRNVRSKKNQKIVLTSNANDDNNVELHKQSSSSCSLEDDSNASQDLNKTRTTRGSATDPQSLYKRREKINERLKILQTLVPNGTKVDISTMLEEAVNYVKFLQLQIKLLSSDDMWMYAPFAYNGFNIGLDLKTMTQS